MAVRIRYKPPFQRLLQHGARPMRRAFIYPHRSVRAIQITTSRWVLALLTAIALTVAVAMSVRPLLAEHNRLCVALLELSGIPVTGIPPVELFARFAAAPLPLVAVDRMEASPLKHWLLFSGAMLVLLGLHRRISFARSFLTFLTTLLVLTAGVVIFHPASQFGSGEFAQMWLRGELLVWLVLPWFSAGLFVLTQPATLFGIAWAALTQAFGFVWSAIRLSFCIAVMHFSGILFAPMFWFALGFLADLIYVVVFYSIAVHWAAKRAWGKRAL